MPLSCWSYYTPTPTVPQQLSLHADVQLPHPHVGALCGIALHIVAIVLDGMRQKLVK